jgi:opacity protein-like surface antigen
MKEIALVLAVATASLALPANAQTPSVEERLARLEAENQMLRHEIDRIKRTVAGTAAAPEPVAAPIEAAAVPSPVSVAAAPVPEASRTPSARQWTGPYVGIGIGRLSSHYEYGSGSGSATISRTSDARGRGVTVQAGYLHQSGLFVIGSEVAVRWPHNITANVNSGATSYSVRTLDTAIQVKGSAGVALGPVHLYGLLGVEVATMDTQIYSGGLRQAFPGKSTATAPLYGAGVALRLASGTSFGVEYNEADFGLLVGTNTTTMRDTFWSVRLNQAF